jgi:alkaline phosphatase D
MIGASVGAPGEVRLTYFPVMKRNASISTEWSKTSAENDFTQQWRLQNLEPGTEYAAVVEARPMGKEALTCVRRGTFQTAFPVDSTNDLMFCMTTCHDYPRRDDGSFGHKIYRAMTSIQPNFVVHAGDIEYYDHEKPWAWTIELMRFKWGRLFSLPNNRAFYANRTTYFQKDDHDTLKDDCWAGQRFGAVTFEQGLKLFNEEQFPTQSPRYTTVRWGKDVQIWLLEGRDYRSPNRMPDGPDKTILGAEQKAWLKKTLSESTAKFKLVFSPTPIVGPDRDNKRDNHANEVFDYEGSELRAAIGMINGAIVFCGDRHWQYASVDPENKVWEFGCGPGSEKHQLGWKAGDVRPSHKFLRVEGGFLSGQLTHNGPVPTLTIRHHKVTGEQVSEFVFP